MGLVMAKEAVTWVVNITKTCKWNCMLTRPGKISAIPNKNRFQMGEGIIFYQIFRLMLTQINNRSLFFKIHFNNINLFM